MLQRLFLSKNTYQNMEIAFLRRIKMKGFSKKVWLVAMILFVMTIGNVHAAKSSFKSIISLLLHYNIII